jgi:uncharacterized membrane protein YcaP (DUF421 family)
VGLRQVVTALSQVKHAVLERNGAISVIPRPSEAGGA